jgi:hypothetical protein
MWMRTEDITAVQYSLGLLDVMPCRLVDGYQHFRGTCCLHLQGSSSPLIVSSLVLSLSYDLIFQWMYDGQFNQCTILPQALGIL